jgi:hypothetical protein
MKQKRYERTKLPEQRGGQNIFHEIWGKMDLSELFSLFNEWINRFKYVIEPERECNAK